MTDRLKMDDLNALQQPIIATFVGGSTWPVYDFEVQTALMRIDVCGLLEIKSFAEVRTLTDGDGIEHDPEDFWHD